MPGVLTCNRKGKEAERQRPCDSRGKDWHLPAMGCKWGHFSLQPSKGTYATHTWVLEFWPPELGEQTSMISNKPYVVLCYDISRTLCTVLPLGYLLPPVYTRLPHISTCAFFTVIFPELMHGASWVLRRCP